MANLKDVYIASGVRTPITSFRSSFVSLNCVDLGTLVAKEVIKRAHLLPDDIEETIFGCVLTAGQGQNIARQISIASDIPKSSQSTTINKVCSSSMKAIIMGSQSIQIGYRNVVLAGGVESMSSTPFYLPRGDIAYGGVPLMDGIQKDGITDSISNKPMGLCAEKTVKEYGFTREQLDNYAIESYRRAETAWKEGLFREEVLPVTVPQKKRAPLVVFEDEEYKRLILSKVPMLNPAFLTDGSGTITAANASSINDGAAAVVLINGDFIENGYSPIAQIISYAEAGVDPVDFTVAPAHAVRKLLLKSGVEIDEISLWEVNEAFAVTPLVFIKELGLSPDRVNIRGGAIALGHPIGASGARIVITLINSLDCGQLGVAAICNGGGEATAILIRKL